MDSTQPGSQETTRIPSATFEAIAVELGLMTPAQVEDCRLIHRTLIDLGLTSTIAEVCVKKGVLDAGQVAAVEAALGRRSELVFPGYQILGKIAEGGMGVVYRARQLSMDRLVAIKVLLPKFAHDEAGRERFIREAHAVARLSHPHVVAGIDAGEVGGVFYFVMEYLDGEPMDQVLRQRGPLPWREAVAIVRQVALALEHADGHGLVHRDIKPGNIMLLADGVVKLADLGLARATTSDDSALTQAGMIVGSPAYLSPEQARGESALDIRSDIFSLGLCLFEFLSGQRVYAGSNPMSVLTELLTHDVKISRLDGMALPAGLRAVLARMTQRDLAQRYVSPRLLCEDLDAVLDERPPTHATAGVALQARLSSSLSSPIIRLGFLAALLLLVAATAFLAGDEQARVTGAPVRAVQSTAVSLSLAEAVDRAQRRVPQGSAYHAELELGRYSIDFAVGDRTHNVVIDGADGRVVEELEEDDNHSVDVQVAKVSLVAAVQAAEKIVAGRTIEAEILLLPGRAVIEVRLLRDGRSVWVDVDGVTGAISTERSRSLLPN